MRIEQLRWDDPGGWVSDRMLQGNADLVLYFGANEALRQAAVWQQLARQFSSALIVGCGTGSHIQGGEIRDSGVAAVAIRYAATSLKLARADIEAASASFACGANLAAQLLQPDLAGVLVLSDGVTVNGSRLIAGMESVLGTEVVLSGGLAGDGAAFHETLVGGNDQPRPQRVVAVGFNGAAVRFGYGSAGGWDAFGPPRQVTRVRDNVLYELDGKPALDLYAHYLGDEAAGLPATALVYPLTIIDPTRAGDGLVRTVLGVDKQARSMIFAGDIPVDATVQLMRGTLQRVTDGAGEAARRAQIGFASDIAGDTLALLISCVGRRLLLGQRTEEEIDAVGEALPARCARLGFYSHGEIAPYSATGGCVLHNQTMSITLMAETLE
jgi:hypothetical protein